MKLNAFAPPPKKILPHSTLPTDTASVTLYGIIGPGRSCIDVAQNAFSALVKKRKLDKKGAVPGHTDLIPKRWFREIEMRIKTANRRTKEGKGKITVMTDGERE